MQYFGSYCACEVYVRKMRVRFQFVALFCVSQSIIFCQSSTKWFSGTYVKKTCACMLHYAFACDKYVQWFDLVRNNNYQHLNSYYKNCEKNLIMWFCKAWTNNINFSKKEILHYTAAAVGCCPAIDKNHSVIQAFGYQCSAAITVSAGNCSDKDTNFM